MSSTPRSTFTAGFSSRGSLLLVLAGTSLAAFLFVVLPRLSESRAAGSRRAVPEVAPEGASAERPRAELVAPQSLVEVADASVAPQIDVVAAAPAKPVAEEPLKEEPPKLRYLRGNGPAKLVDGKDPRISNREQRRLRRENAARGILPEPQEKIFKTPPDRSRFSTKGNQAGGLVQGKGKKKKDG